MKNNEDEKVDEAALVVEGNGLGTIQKEPTSGKCAGCGSIPESARTAIAETGQSPQNEHKEGRKEGQEEAKGERC